jgi:cell division protein FtsI/penicillin-binding protein 2
MTARSRERGSHAGLPRGFSQPGAAGAPAAGSRRRKPGSRRKPSTRRGISKRQRAVAVMVVMIGVLAIGFVTDFGAESSAESTVQAFLLDWQQGKYTQAAALTTGGTSQVAAQLSAAYHDLNATAAFISLGPIAQHGSTANAAFKATYDLAEGSDQWAYTGRFTLIARDGKWLVDWSQSVINPSLRPGDRLAVVTSYAPRAQIEDQSGHPLQYASTDYHIGVYPEQLANVARTADEFSEIAGLDEQQVLGQVRAAPPKSFLSLLTLDPASFWSLWPRLAKVPGLTFQQRSERLFATDAAEVVGDVGTENSRTLRDEGAAYEPGETVGVSGLEQAYQDTLVGTPTTSVVVIDAAGRETSTLWTSAGRPGTPVRTTLNGDYQAAAAQVLGSQSSSGEIVAVDSATGKILALAAHQAGSVGLPAGGPLNARITPGMAFSIVSAAAMVADGVQPGTPLPCYSSEAVGGQTFTYTGQQSWATFASDFANGCGTAFASMSTRLTPAQLAAAEKSFGVGADWNLRLRAFSGTARAATPGASLAAQSIGTSGVQMSPLGMALVAAEVDAGVGHAPALISSDPPATWQAPLSDGQLGELRGLMRDAVRSGSARAANLSGQPVYGQAGVVQTGPHSWLSWFAGYRGGVAISALETGTTQSQAAASLAGAFLRAVG